jgi:hypothetical protein
MMRGCPKNLDEKFFNNPKFKSEWWVIMETDHGGPGRAHSQSSKKEVRQRGCEGNVGGRRKTEGE